jgi:hypothetical protein
VRESNPHAFRRRILSALCLPFHQPGVTGGPQGNCILFALQSVARPLARMVGALRDRPVTWVILAGPGIADRLSPPRLDA